MTRLLAGAALAAALIATAPGSAAEPKATGTVDIFSSVEDPAQQRMFPGTGVLTSQKEWEQLAAAWGIQNPPKVDFTKEILVVGTWKGASFKFLSEVKNGDLTVELVGDKEMRPGFRFRVVSLDRTGITRFQGKELPAATAEGPKPIERPAVDLSGDLADRTLQRRAPASGVITSHKEWEVLVKEWSIADAPRVDFTKEVLVVAYSNSDSFTLTPTVKDGNLTIATTTAGQTRDGFRWRVMSVRREGVQTVNGQPLPKADPGPLPKTEPVPVPVTRPPVELAGEVADRARLKRAPVTGIITSKADWNALVLAWDIQGAPEFDFRDVIVVVAYSEAESFTLTPVVKDGNLTITTTQSDRVREGFRWKVVAVKREGVRTINGKPLPNP